MTAGTALEPERIRILNEQPERDGRYVLYWMQQSQRTRENPALELAVQRANALGLPGVVGFGLTADYPEANARHYRFMLEGLADVAGRLAGRGIPFVLRRGSPPAVALELAREAAAVVCDRGYLRHQKAWREELAREAGCRVTQVEGDVVVPVDAVTAKREYAARTLRPKIGRLRDRYLRELRATPYQGGGAGGEPPAGESLADPDRLLAQLAVDRSVPPVSWRFRGGEEAARDTWLRFLEQRLPRYAAHRNRPETDDVSYMGMYLHFGQVSPVWLARTARAAGASAEDRDALLEELVVRRELAMNFVHHSDDYDRYDTLPDWARRTLDEHRRDPRPHLYDRAALEAGATHDPYWNAAMAEMRATGYMHNYMRMYWGKKILEWSAGPEEAFATALAINNKYFLDGRDPNSYTGVAWVFGLHDRAWQERPVLGKIRYMAASGLERKCDIGAYVAKVERLAAAVPAS